MKEELPKAAASVDFTAGYKDSVGDMTKKAGELSGVWRRMASHGEILCVLLNVKVRTQTKSTQSDQLT